MESEIGSKAEVSADLLDPGESVGPGEAALVLVQAVAGAGVPHAQGARGVAAHQHLVLVLHPTLVTLCKP